LQAGVDPFHLKCLDGGKGGEARKSKQMEEGEGIKLMPERRTKGKFLNPT